MPIDNEGIIHPKKTQKDRPYNAKKGVNIKIIGLIITNFVAVCGCIISIYALHLQKLQYENSIKVLALEKEKFESMLKENNIQIQTSYIVCQVRDIEYLYSWLDEYDVRIYSNDLTTLFYDNQTHHYCDENDFLFLDDDENGFLFIDDGENDTYNWIYSEVVFLRIDINSNRIVKDINLHYTKINMNNNVIESQYDLASYKENGEEIVVNLGEASPNEMLLIPLAIRHPIYYMNEGNETSVRYKLMYIPQEISYYDEFYEDTFRLDIRDLLEGGFITEFGYYGQG